MSLSRLLQQAQQQSPDLQKDLRSDGPLYKLLAQLIADDSADKYNGALLGAAVFAAPGSATAIPGTNTPTTLLQFTHSVPTDAPASGMLLSLAAFVSGSPVGATDVSLLIAVQVNGGPILTMVGAIINVGGTEAIARALSVTDPSLVVLPGDSVLVRLIGTSTVRAVAIQPPTLLNGASLSATLTKPVP